MSSITEISKYNATDLQRVTGLKMSNAEECVNLFGSYAPALASFVQSFNKLPDTFFDNRKVTEENARVINKQLHVIYQHARELKQSSEQKNDEDVWKMFTNNTATKKPIAESVKLGNESQFINAGKFTSGSSVAPTAAATTTTAQPFAMQQQQSFTSAFPTSPFTSSSSSSLAAAAATSTENANKPSAFSSAFDNINLTAPAKSVFGNASTNNNNNSNNTTMQKPAATSVFGSNIANLNSINSKSQTNAFAALAASKAASPPSAFNQVKSSFAGNAMQFKSVFTAPPPTSSTATSAIPSSPFTSSTETKPVMTDNESNKKNTNLPSILGEPPSVLPPPPPLSSSFPAMSDKSNNNTAIATTTTTTTTTSITDHKASAIPFSAVNTAAPNTTYKSKFFDPTKEIVVTSPFTSTNQTTAPPLPPPPPYPSSSSSAIASNAPPPSMFAFGTASQTCNTSTNAADAVATADVTTAPTPAAFGFGQPLITSSTAETNAAKVEVKDAASNNKVNDETTDKNDNNNISETSASVSEKTITKEIRYCAPTHFTGPFFEMPTFWETEVLERAPLLNLDYGFLESNKDHLRERLLKWVKKAEFYKKPVKYVAIDDDDEKVVRVIIKDADRTFFQPEHREKLVAFLHAMYHEFNAYGQAMSYLAGLCMLVLNEEETAAVIRFVATQYIRGHWAEEAVGFSTNAWVVEYFMQKRFPDVAQHLLSLNLWPDTYLQKILTGLCIHMLRFNELFQFLDAFIQDGFKYLIRFCLTLIEHFRSDILAVQDSKECGTVYELMRLDEKVADLNDVRAILKRVEAIDLGSEGNSIDLIRSNVYERKVEPRLKRAPKTETFEPCSICEKHRPTWWNEDMGAVCEGCKEDNPTINFEKY